MSVPLRFLSACNEVYTMTTNVTDPTLDGQWLDFYALLDVPVSADEDAIRRRIGKVYGEAASNTEHRDLGQRMYFQSLVERVLPQARRVLLDPQWRAKYDRQHILHSIGDPSAQNYVAFIAAMRGGEISNQPNSDLSQLPARVQDEIVAAREVIECARAGLELELLPSQSVKGTPSAQLSSDQLPCVLPSQPKKPVAPARPRSVEEKREVAPKEVASKEVAPKDVAPKDVAPGASKIVPAKPIAASKEEVSAPAIEAAPPKPAPQKTKSVPVVEVQDGEPVQVKTLTAQEARDIRRRRESNVDSEPMIAPASLRTKASDAKPARKSFNSSRIAVGETAYGPKRILSPNTLNLLVAITGVLFTISIQKFASTPAVAVGQSRMPVFLAASPEMASALGRAEGAWEKSPDGNAFDLVVQDAPGEAGVRRALGRGGNAPDAWIPASNTAVEQLNALAAKSKRQMLLAGDSIARTPVVLVARADRARVLRARFPSHRIPSWNALRAAVGEGAVSRFGLSDPQKTTVGALVRFSMAREWSESRGVTAGQAVSDGAFWSWMSGFERNTPSAYATTKDVMNDLSQDGASRVWWGLAWESDALRAMNDGQNFQVWYLPRTLQADHPFCEVERVGAPVEVAQARESFRRFLLSDEGQKQLLLSGMRPSSLSLTSRVKGNPFINSSFAARGLKPTLGADERDASKTLAPLVAAWAKRWK